MQYILFANSPSAGSDYEYVVENDNGFAFNNITGGGVNDTGNYIYVAIAENVVAGEFGPTGTLTADADDNGPTISLSDVTGTWEAGMEVVNDTEITEFAPGADDLAFTSSVPAGTGITAYGQATWQVDTDVNFSSPMTATKSIAPANSIQFLLPSERGAIVLAEDTTYNIRLKYDAANPSGIQSAYSDVNQFTTAGSAGQDGWNLESLPSGPWNDIAYGDGKYVIIGGDGSTNGKAIYSDSISGPWTQITDSKLNQSYFYHYKVAYGNGVWVITSNIGSGNSTIYYTNDLSGAWQEASTIPNNKNVINLCFGGGKFVAFSSNASLNPAMHSTDGNVWTSAASYGGTTDLDLRFTTGMIYADNKFITFGNHFSAEGNTNINALMYSEDGGVNWVKQTIVSSKWLLCFSIYGL